MSLPITRLGDFCTGHADFPPRPNVTGASKVFAGGIPVHRVGDFWAPHCNEDSCHPGVTVVGSRKVFAQGLQVARIGDVVDCGSLILSGFPKVLVG